MSVRFDQRLIKTEDVLFQEIDGESVLLSVTAGQYFGLNESSHRMWLLLIESDSIQQAYEKLLGEFEVEPERLNQDLNDLIDQLIEHGLVQVTA